MTWVHVQAIKDYFCYFQSSCCVCEESWPCFLCDFVFQCCCGCCCWLSQLGRLLLLEMWRSDTELAAGEKEQLGENRILPAAEERPGTPLSDYCLHLLCECLCHVSCMNNCLHLYMASFNLIYIYLCCVFLRIASDVSVALGMRWQPLVKGNLLRYASGTH